MSSAPASSSAPAVAANAAGDTPASSGGGVATLHRSGSNVPLAQQAGSTSTPTNRASVSQLPVADAALDFWRRFDLGAKKNLLDKQALELREAKDQTLRARKRLAETTREFKKKGESERLGQFDELLKSYQEEIDNLTRRAKSSDGAFLGLYQELYDAPDPAPHLATASHDRTRASTLELELGRLHREVQEYEEEFLKLKNQDITIRQLEEQLSVYESAMEERVEAALSKARQDIHEVAEARVKEALEREKRLEERVKRAERAQDEVQASAEKAQSRLFEVTRQAEERAAAMQAEKELLVQESERHAAEAHAAKREAEGLRSKLEALSKGEEEGGLQGPAARESKKRIAELEREMEELSGTLASLRQRLVTKEEDWAAHRAAEESRIQKLQEELDSEREARGRAETELEGRPTREQMESLRSQLRVLQQLEFNVLPTDEDQTSDGGPKTAEAPGEEGSGGEVNMEQLLMGRIRRMETELMSTRRKLSDTEAAKSKTAEALRDAESRLAGQSSLIQRLEEDLAQLYQMQSSVRSNSFSVDNTTALPALPPTATPNHPPSRKHSHSVASNVESGEVDFNELLSTTSLSTGGARPQSSIGGRGPEDDDQGGVDLVRILQAQRDRYKHRVRILEGEAEGAGREANKFKAQAEQLQRDNVALYEKIKFLQSYHTGGPVRPPPPPQHALSAPLTYRGHHATPGAMEDGSLSASEARYRAMYEEQINPFTQFSAAEKARRYGELSVAEKATLHMTRFFLASKAARSFVFFYALGLHLLVFFTLYLWSWHHCDDLKLNDSLHIPHDHFGALHPMPGADSVSGLGP